MGAADPPLTIAEVLRRSAAYLSERGSPSPRLDADLLLAHALGVERLRALHRLGAPADAARADPRPRPAGPPRPPRAGGLPHRRARLPPDEPARRAARAGAPARDRALVEWALEVAPPGAAVVDWGSGSGAVALALAGEGDGLRVTALERSPEALEAGARQRRPPGPSGGVAALGRLRRRRRAAASR